MGHASCLGHLYAHWAINAVTTIVEPTISLGLGLKFNPNPNVRLVVIEVESQSSQAKLIVQLNDLTANISS